MLIDLDQSMQNLCDLLSQGELRLFTSLIGRILGWPNLSPYLKHLLYIYMSPDFFK